MEQLTVKKMRDALGQYPAIAHALRNLSDDTEILEGDMIVVPGAIAGAMYDRNWLAEVIGSTDREATDEVIDEVLESCDLDDMIGEALAEAAWETAEYAVDITLSETEEEEGEDIS